MTPLFMKQWGGEAAGGRLQGCRPQVNRKDLHTP